MEELKQIMGTNNLYYCDRDGRVYNENKEEKAQYVDANGYMITTIDRKFVEVHKLIAATFVKNPNNFSIVNHINGCKKDNHVENLEWLLNESNISKHYQTKAGIAGMHTDEKSFPVKATNIETGYEIIFGSVMEACRELGIIPSCVLRCVNGKKKSSNGYKFEKTCLSPVYNVIPVPVEKIHSNSYNPNSVAPPEMKLLYTSIKEDWYTQPIVCYRLDNGDYEIVDGFHRYLIMINHKDIYEREHGMIPVVVIDKPINNRMASTIRHNRARGSHAIELMSNIVSELIQSGMSDSWILNNIGMDADELLRLKQITGLAALFRDKEFSDSKEI